MTRHPLNAAVGPLSSLLGLQYRWAGADAAATLRRGAGCRLTLATGSVNAHVLASQTLGTDRTRRRCPFRSCELNFL